MKMNEIIYGTIIVILIITAIITLIWLRLLSRMENE